MKKQVLMIVVSGLLLALSASLTSCIKTKSDPLDAILGTYTGVLVDSSLVTNHPTTYTSFPITVAKLTSSRIGITSTVAQIEPFYADLTTSPTGFYFSIPGQTNSDKNVQGANVPSFSFPAGYTGVFVTATHTLTFASRVDNTTTGQGVICMYTGTE